MNLALAEFLLALVGIPMDILPLHTDAWTVGKEACITTGVVVTTAGRNTFENKTLHMNDISRLKRRMVNKVLAYYLPRFRFYDDTNSSLSLSYVCFSPNKWDGWKSLLLQNLH